MKEHGDTWSIAHMCVSLPLPEETMIILLASDSFKDHFTSTCHPRGYTILHLAVELNSVSACRAIMRCGDQWLSHMAPGLHVEDIEGSKETLNVVGTKENYTWKVKQGKCQRCKATIT